MLGKTATSKISLQPIDRLARGLMLLLTLLIGILLWSGDHSAPRVRKFSWQNKQIGSEDTAFILTFNRPMNQASVEENLTIEPPLPGKISWAGRRMAYTPLSPVPYGTKYQLRLTEAKDKFAHEDEGKAIDPFTATFRSRDRAFAYIGVEPEEKGRLILFNLTQQQKTVLTPPDLVVMDFQPYPDREKILFSASTSQSQDQGLLNQQLYTVTTGMSFQSSEQKSFSAEAVGKVQLVLDSKEYQNLKFDLSADGETIVVGRVNRQNPADFGLWTVTEEAKPRPLENQPGGDFVITPDSSSLAVAQGQGVAILPFQPGAEPLDFLPKFGMVLSFARDGSAAAMVKFNNDYTRSLFFVTNQGIQKEILRTTGSILDCDFAPNKENLYCVLTELIEGEEYLEEPYIGEIDLKPTEESERMTVKPLVILPEQRDMQMSLSPDGLALLFDQVATKAPEAADGLRTDEGQAIATGLLWLLPVLNDTTSDAATKLQPEQLLPGFHPRWLP
ncbi:MAG: Ig-like domain-containing protein [Coleofasciculaceae cyanobacterium]